MEENHAEPDASGDAAAFGLAVAAPGEPRGALVASGETETGTLSSGTGTVARGLSLRTTRRAPVSANAQSDLEDEWADDPGARRVAPRLLQPDGGPGSAVVAPPTHSGTLRMVSAGGPRSAQLLELFGYRVRDKNLAVDEFFVRFNSLGFLKHSDFDAKKGDEAVQLRNDIWNWADPEGVEPLGRDGEENLRRDMMQLYQLLDAEVQLWLDSL